MYRVKKIFILLFIIIIILIGYYIPLFITKSPPIVTINNKLYYTYSKELEIPPFTIFSEKDISSLKYMKWLKVISISVENLNDISFFSQMNNLEEIYFTNLDCQINDWSPIENCINLKSFSGTFLKFNDLECFSTLNDLKYLCLLDCEVKDISGIENLKNLNTFEISGKHTNDFTSLNKLSNLSTLKILDADITDISFLKDLKNLNNLSLYGNKIQDYSPIFELPHLKKLTIDKGTLGEKELTKLKEKGINVTEI